MKTKAKFHKKFSASKTKIIYTQRDIGSKGGCAVYRVASPILVRTPTWPCRTEQQLMAKKKMLLRTHLEEKYQVFWQKRDLPKTVETLNKTKDIVEKTRKSKLQV